jgi:SAM-dependent methyltransferase
MTADWLSFWDKPHSIYVSARHKNVHYRLIAQEIARHVAALFPSRPARVLDYGCGEALHADIVAAACGELLLCEGAPKVRAGLSERFAAIINIRVLTPEQVARLPDRSLDFIVLHSVAQYLTGEQTQTLFAEFHRLLRADGALLVSDVIPPRLPPSIDVAALLRFAAANGFLLAALFGLTRTLFSDYWRLRARIGLTQYSEAAMLDKLAAAGFSAHRAEKNIGHSQARMAFVARPR